MSTLRDRIAFGLEGAATTKPSPPVIDIVPNQVYKVLITNPNTTSNFGVQFDKHLADVDNIQTICQKYGPTSSKLTMDEVRAIGTICMAQFTDDVWYRASVRDFDESSGLVTVYFIDFGNVDAVSFDRHVRKCPDEVATILPRVTECQWKYSNPDGGDRMEKFLDELEKLSDDDAMVEAKVIDIKNKTGPLMTYGIDAGPVVLSIPSLEQDLGEGAVKLEMVEIVKSDTGNGDGPAVVSTPAEVISTPAEVISTPAEVISTPTEVISTPTEVISTPTEVISTQAVVLDKDAVDGRSVKTESVEETVVAVRGLSQPTTANCADWIGRIDAVVLEIDMMKNQISTIQENVEKREKDKAETDQLGNDAADAEIEELRKAITHKDTIIKWLIDKLRTAEKEYEAVAATYKAEKEKKEAALAEVQKQLAKLRTHYLESTLGIGTDM